MNRESCKHFTGVQNKVCKLGICYDSFPQDSIVPCLPGIHGNHHAKCDKFEAPTADELAAREKQIKASIERIGIAHAAIVEELKRRFKAGDRTVNPLDPRDKYRWHGPQDNYYSGAGEMACPCCESGRLRYSRAAYNGHIHAACSTPKCVRWME